MTGFIKKIRENEFLRAFFHFYQASEADITSIAVAYYFLISIFPLLLIAANILPYFQIRPDELLVVLKDLLPESLYLTIAKVVRDVLTKPSTRFAEYFYPVCPVDFFPEYDFFAKGF